MKNSKKYINNKYNFCQKLKDWAICQTYEVVKFTGKKGLMVRATWSGKLLKMSLRVNGSYQFIGIPTFEGVGYLSNTKINFHKS